jgi:hypothetical protein
MLDPRSPAFPGEGESDEIIQHPVGYFGYGGIYMTHTFYHAKSSVKRWGGTVEDYLAIHEWFDAGKEHCGTFLHRALRHHAEGIFWAEEKFGKVITNSDGKIVPVRYVGELHTLEDCGKIPTLNDWLSRIQPAGWMARATVLNHGTRGGEK